MVGETVSPSLVGLKVGFDVDGDHVAFSTVGAYVELAYPYP